jgi:shikimate dehydrogenase
MIMNASGKTRLYCVIGDPIEHSLSPVMQNAAFEALKLNCVFLAFKVAPSDVENALRGMRGLGICGMNVTMPDKNAVIENLDEVDEAAKFLESVNTIKNENGKLKGFSTDGIGALNALRKNDVSLSGKELVLFGAGGAARAIAFALAKEVEEITILNRTPEKTAKLSKELTRLHSKKVASGPLTTSAIKESLKNADILINATSVGMKHNSEITLVNPKLLRPDLTVMDIVYNPIETKLAKEAKTMGAKVINGLEMLIYQGAASFEIWTGLEAPVEVMRKAVLNNLTGA